MINKIKKIFKQPIKINDSKAAKLLSDLKNYKCKLMPKERSEQILNGKVSTTKDNIVFVTTIDNILYEIIFNTDGTYTLVLDHFPINKHDITVEQWNLILKKILYSNNISNN